MCVFLSLGMCISGVVAFIIKNSMAIVYALIILFVVLTIAVIWCVLIQKRYRN